MPDDQASRLIPGRRHSAVKIYGSGGTRLRCNAPGCGWESDPTLTHREQREQHRRHRREMGEAVPTKPLKLEQHERLRMIMLAHTPPPGQALCPECEVPHPCMTRRLADGEPPHAHAT